MKKVLKRTALTLALLLISLNSIVGLSNQLFAEEINIKEEAPERNEHNAPTSGLHKDDAAHLDVGIINSIYDNSILKKFGEIAVTETIEYKGESYDLYPVFVDREEALKNFDESFGSIYSSEKFRNISKEDWRSDLYSVREVLSTEKISIEDIDAIEQFMDVYSGYWYNERVLNYVKENNSREDEDEYFEELARLLPYTSPLAKAYNEKLMGK